jgi:hypothetical protein
MKQLIPLFLFLLPCLAWAQYPSNGNQKITLGEQTTADGLLFRGVAATDTVRKPSVDTMAYMVLDTTTNIIWHYKKATSNAWLRLNLLPSDTASMLTPYWRADRFSGVLPVANGGTNLTTLSAANRIPFASSATALTTDNGLRFDNSTNKSLIVENASGAATLSIFGEPASGSIIRVGRGKNTAVLAQIDNKIFYGGGDADGFSGFFAGGEERMILNTAGELGIGYGATDNGAYKLQVNSQIFATNATIATSDIRFKENIQPLDKGLEIINKLKPVKFNFITTTENNFSEFDEIGFIAQDVEGAMSTELFAKAVVKKLDEDKDDSALGLMTEKLIPILVKAIQEQQALIKALEQRIINLENK